MIHLQFYWKKWFWPKYTVDYNPWEEFPGLTNHYIILGPLQLRWTRYTKEI